MHHSSIYTTGYHFLYPSIVECLTTNYTNIKSEHRAFPSVHKKHKKKKDTDEAFIKEVCTGRSLRSDSFTVHELSVFYKQAQAVHSSSTSTPPKKVEEVGEVKWRKKIENHGGSEMEVEDEEIWEGIVFDLRKCGVAVEIL